MNIYLTFALLTYLMLIGFLCYSALKPKWRTLDLKWKIVMAPLSLFYLVDVFLRLTLFWALFQVAPTMQTITVTKLCNYLVSDQTFRGRWARSICRQLNLFDQGHCAAYNGGNP